MNVSQRILLGDILAEKVASKMCWFSGIHISVASGSSISLNL
jgi:hypothetical protein